jgi:hypothetical protein
VICSEVGAVILTDTLIVAAEELPARSVPTTVIELDTKLSGTVQEKVEPLTAAGAPLQDTPPTPDKASLMVPETETDGVLTDAPLVGLVILTVGGVRSKFTVALVVAVFEAVSLAVPVITWPAPSVLTVAGEEQLEIGAPPGRQLNVTVTVELFHPLLAGDGEAEAEMPGSAISANFVTNEFCVPPSDVW